MAAPWHRRMFGLATLAQLGERASWVRRGKHASELWADIPVGDLRRDSAGQG
jgi:hypothetical protein